MKTKVTLLALAMVTLQSVALAQQTPTLSATSKPVERQQVHIVSPLDLNPAAVKEKTAIDRVGGISSQPWPQTVGWHNGQSTSWNPDIHEAQFCLLSLGH